MVYIQQKLIFEFIQMTLLLIGCLYLGPLLFKLHICYAEGVVLPMQFLLHAPEFLIVDDRFTSNQELPQKHQDDQGCYANINTTFQAYVSMPGIDYEQNQCWYKGVGYKRLPP